jgi:non-heme chloroperoxidase
MGGGVSLVAVGEDRVDATALVLVDIAPRIEKRGVDRITAFMSQRPEGFDSLEEIAEAISNYQPHRRRTKDLQGLAKNVRLAPNGKYRWHWDPQLHPGRHDLNERQQRLEACARGLELPTLLVRGGLSDLLTEEGARDFLRLCPHCEYVNVADAAHMVAGDRNDVFASAVIDFLRRTVPVGGQPLKPPHQLEAHHVGPPGDLQDVP